MGEALPEGRATLWVVSVVSVAIVFRAARHRGHDPGLDPYPFSL